MDADRAFRHAHSSCPKTPGFSSPGFFIRITDPILKLFFEPITRASSSRLIGAAYYVALVLFLHVPASKYPLDCSGYSVHGHCCPSRWKARFARAIYYPFLFRASLASAAETRRRIRPTHRGSTRPTGLSSPPWLLGGGRRPMAIRVTETQTPSTTRTWSYTTQVFVPPRSRVVSSFHRQWGDLQCSVHCRGDRARPCLHHDSATTRTTPRRSISSLKKPAGRRRPSGSTPLARWMGSSARASPRGRMNTSWTARSGSWARWSTGASGQKVSWFSAPAELAPRTRRVTRGV